MEKTFCGKQIEVLVEKPIDVERCWIFGEIQAQGVQSYNIGERCKMDDISENNCCFIGKIAYYQPEEKHFRFIAAPGKWTCPVNIVDCHRFQVICYQVVDDIIVSTVLSTVFSIKRSPRKRTKPVAGGVVSSATKTSSNTMTNMITERNKSMIKKVRFSSDDTDSVGSISSEETESRTSQTPTTTSSSSMSPIHVMRATSSPPPLVLSPSYFNQHIYAIPNRNPLQVPRFFPPLSPPPTYGQVSITYTTPFQVFHPAAPGSSSFYHLQQNGRNF